MTDREQTRRDEHLVRSALLALFEEGVSDGPDAQEAEDAFSRVLAELEQAARERDDWKLGMAEQVARRADAENRLAKVLAFVEAVKLFIVADEHSPHPYREYADVEAALADYEQDTQAAHTARGHDSEERTGGSR